MELMLKNKCNNLKNKNFMAFVQELFVSPSYALSLHKCN